MLAVFLTFAVVLFPFHVSARHLSVMVPLLAPLVGYGVTRVVRPIPMSGRARGVATGVLSVVLCLPSLAITVTRNRNIMRLDSRTVARDWFVENLSASDRILLEDEGPALNPNRHAIERMQEDLSQIAPGPFTHHQERRLDLLSRYPPADGRQRWPASWTSFPSCLGSFPSG